MTRRNAIRTSACLAAALALPALAGEGRIPIYAPTTTITAPGKYVVTRNLDASGSGANVIRVVADDVDIDLNGFYLKTDGAAVIAASGFNNLVVRDGTLIGGTRSIEILGSAASAAHTFVLEGIRAIKPQLEAFFLLAATDFAIRDNDVFAAGAASIYVDAASAPPAQGAIERNRIEGGGGGIFVLAGSSVAIQDNRIRGLTLSPSPAPPANGAIVYDDSDAGLIAGNTIEGVTSLLASGGNGIYLGDASGCEVRDNAVRWVSDDGIDVAGLSDDNLILENAVSQSARDGIRVEGSRNHVDRNVTNQNCQSGTGACWGLHFSGVFGGADNTYGRNTARGNLGTNAGCPWPGPPANPPTTDFCDEQLPGPSGGCASFQDNLMPMPF